MSCDILELEWLLNMLVDVLADVLQVPIVCQSGRHALDIPGPRKVIGRISPLGRTHW